MSNLDPRLQPFVRGTNERGEPIVDVSAMAGVIDSLRSRITEVLQIRLQPLTKDGYNNDEVDAFHDGFHAAMCEVREALKGEYHGN